MTVQSVLFGEFADDSVTVDVVAGMFSVSTASVRNWIKTGYLEQTTKSGVSKSSVEHFMHNVAGTEKLVARANKLHKSTEAPALFEITTNDVETLGECYEQTLSEAYKNKEGIYYTPPHIAADFFKHLPQDKSMLQFCDPCCGSGNFIVEAIKAGFKPENVYGYDIDPTAVEITRKRVAALVGNASLGDNFECEDFLARSCAQKITRNFDVILTNPPWGKKLPSDIKKAFSHALGFSAAQDTSTLFMFACLNLLKQSGYLGFLVQEAFFNVASFEQARKRILALPFVALTDYGKPFSGLVTKAKGIVVKNAPPNKQHVVRCFYDGESFQREQASFLKNPKHILNFSCSPAQAEVVAHLYAFPNQSLRHHAEWGLGIVTGNNKKHVSPETRDDYVPIYKGADIAKNALKPPSGFICEDFSLYQQVAPKALYQAPEKLIYRFISSDLVFFYDNQQRYILNSANMMILNKEFSINMQQLAQLLNSKVINWVFKIVFDTHKVLRSDLEALPIHTGYFEQNTVFDDEKYAEYLGLEMLEDGTYRVKK